MNAPCLEVIFSICWDILYIDIDNLEKEGHLKIIQYGGQSGPEEY